MGGDSSTDAPDPAAPRVDRLFRGPADVWRVLAIAIVAIAAMVAIAVDWDSPARAVLALAFVLFVPGLALAELLEITDPLERLAIATGASLALETLLAIGLLYAGLFSAEAASAIVAGVTCITLLAAVRRRGWRWHAGLRDTEPRGAAT